MCRIDFLMYQKAEGTSKVMGKVISIFILLINAGMSDSMGLQYSRVLNGFHYCVNRRCGPDSSCDVIVVAGLVASRTARGCSIVGQGFLACQ